MKPVLCIVSAALVLAFASAVRPAAAQIGRRDDALHNSLEVRRAFAPAIAKAVDSTATIIVGGAPVAMGIVVSADGCILTKASELRGAITVRVRNSVPMPARILGCALEHDLAMIKIDAANLTPIEFDTSGDPPVGKWVATVGTTPVPIAVGVVSAPRRSIFASVMMGVMLGDYDGKGALVSMVNPTLGAARAGMLVNDVIIRIDATQVHSRADVTAELSRRTPGQVLSVTVLRDGHEAELKLTLTKRAGPTTRTARQNHMGGKLSDRRDGFAAVIQNDMVAIQPRDCGSAIVTLDGNVVGMNIARAGRTEVFAIPGQVLAQVVPELRAGKFPPTTNPSDLSADVASSDAPRPEAPVPDPQPSSARR